MKKGGVLKLQSGGSPIDVYLNKYVRPASAKTSAATAKKGYAKSKIGTVGDTLKNMNDPDNFLKVASTAGTVASFIPGVGVVGGAVMTVADLMRDLRDNGKIDNWGEHGLNLGFTALSAIGLGGLKGVLMGAKAIKGAKAGKEAFDLVKLLKGADEVAKVSKSAKLGKTVEGLTKLESKVGSKGVETILTKLDEGTKLTRTETSALKQAGFFKGTKTTSKVATTPKGNVDFGKELLGKTTKKTVTKTVINPSETSQALSQGIADVANASKASTYNPTLINRGYDYLKSVKLGKAPKYAKNIAAGTMIASGLPAAGRAIGDIKEGGLGNVQMEDLERVAISASLGKQWIRNARNLKTLRKYTKPAEVTASTTKLVGGKKPITLEENMKIPKESKLPFVSKKINKARDAKLRKSLEEQGLSKKKIDKLMKDRSSLKVEHTPGTSSGLQMDEESLTRAGASLKHYKKAKKMLEEGIKFKEGGILKFQNPAGSLPKKKGSWLGEWFQRNSWPEMSTK